jgi:hypothetical protein
VAERKAVIDGPVAANQRAIGTRGDRLTFFEFEELQIERERGLAYRALAELKERCGPTFGAM